MAAIGLEQKKLSECVFLNNIDETCQEPQEEEPAEEDDVGLVYLENKQDFEDDKRVPNKVTALAVQQKTPGVSQLIITCYQLTEFLLQNQ